MIHYHFKFQTGNVGLRKFPNLKEGDNVPLSIYYGQWIYEKWLNDREWVIANYESAKSKLSQNQIDKFYSIKDNFTNFFFWLFYNDEILYFKPLNGVIRDGPNYLIDKKGSFPKSIDAKLVSIFRKYSLPEVFANINSNQKYNRMTIAKLEGAEKLIADSLINKNKIDISHRNYFKFLSPIEFETLIFLIFNSDSSFCSSFRGGALKDFDLKISLSKDIFGLNKGDYWVQSKKDIKDKLIPPKGTILVHLGKTDISNGVIGLEWLNNIITKREDILEWLKEMTFNYEMFNFVW